MHVDSGTSVMRAAVNNAVPGIDGDCGGACACGTCHVYLDDDWLQKVGEASEIEISLLELASKRTEGSRLACQIEVVPEFDGLVVRMPPSQP